MGRDMITHVYTSAHFFVPYLSGVLKKTSYLSNGRDQLGHDNEDTLTPWLKEHLHIGL